MVIKYSNFCRKNFLAPLDIKLRVLDTCVSSSLIYGCETWGNSNFSNVETLYRQGLKCALSVRSSVNNEIFYVETGEWPLQIRITKQQLKFWLSIQTMLRDDNHYITKLVRKAENIEIRYIQYYQLSNYPIISGINEQKINAESVIDNDSRLGSYLQVKPNLTKPNYRNTMEFQRVYITRYRTGSHNLKIELGRSPRIYREDRVCKCNSGVQTLRHCLLHCPLLADVQQAYQITDIENGVTKTGFLLEMERILEL